jgi:hypothetical protein
LLKSDRSQKGMCNAINKENSCSVTDCVLSISRCKETKFEKEILDDIIEITNLFAKKSLNHLKTLNIASQEMLYEVKI